jgi:lysine biosynthesis protein LysW
MPMPTATLVTIDTEYGRIEVDPTGLRLGELLVTDEGAELEVVGLGPLRFEPAPEEDEDWGE